MAEERVPPTATIAPVEPLEPVADDDAEPAIEPGSEPPPVCLRPDACGAVAPWRRRCEAAAADLPAERHVHLEACLATRCDFEHCLAYAHTTPAIGYLLGTPDPAQFEMGPRGSASVSGAMVLEGTATTASRAVADLRSHLRRCHQQLGGSTWQGSQTFVFTVMVNATGQVTRAAHPEADERRRDLRACLRPHLEELELGTPSGTTATVRFVAMFRGRAQLLDSPP